LYKHEFYSRTERRMNFNITPRSKGTKRRIDSERSSVSRVLVLAQGGQGARRHFRFVARENQDYILVTRLIAVTDLRVTTLRVACKHRVSREMRVQDQRDEINGERGVGRRESAWHFPPLSCTVKNVPECGRMREIAVKGARNGDKNSGLSGFPSIIIVCF